jgi:zinc protease
LASEIVMNEIYGLPFDEYLHAKTIYDRVTPKDLQMLAIKLFSRPSVLSTVGPA